MYACMHVCTYACMNVCTYACMHVCTYEHMHLCMYARMHVCMYARMHVCTYACMHVCTYERMHLCMYAPMYVSTYARMHARMHVCMYARMYVCMHARMHVCTYACMHVCTYACMHVCTYACMHVCTHARMHVCMCARMHACTCAKCVVFACNSGYATCKEKGITTFLFPLEKPYLLQQWNRFVNRSEWVPSCNSVICIKHFEEKFIIRGKKNNLMWSLNPIPTINTKSALKRPSTLPTPIIPRKAPKLRVFQKDQSGEFSDNCKIDSFEDLCGKGCLNGFSLHAKRRCCCFLQCCV